MAKTDWTGSDTVKPADMNEIGQEINQLREDVDNIHIPPATLTEAGIVQLSNATDSTSEAMAATPKAVKAAYDRGSAGVSAAAAAQAKADAAETPAGAQAKANAAETNAKSYADQNFYNKTKIDAVNLVRNGTALFGLQDWVVQGGSWSYSENDANVGGYFYPSAPVAAGTHIFIESQPIYVFTSTNYYLGCTFHTNGGLTSDLVRIELVNASSGVVLGSIRADDNKWWHRKTVVVNTGNVDTVKIRLVATGPLTNAATVIRGFSQVTLSIASADVYHNQGDWRSLFQSVANGKTNIASAISGKGVPASGSDTFATLASKIGQISTGIKMAKFDNPSMSGTIGNLAFTPKIVVFKVHFGAMNVNVSVESDNYLLGFNVDGNLVLTDNYAVGRYSGASGASGSVYFDTNGLVFGQNYINYSLQSSNQTTNRNVISVYIFGV